MNDIHESCIFLPRSPEYPPSSFIASRRMTMSPVHRVALLGCCRRSTRRRSVMSMWPKSFLPLLLKLLTRSCPMYKMHDVPVVPAMPVPIWLYLLQRRSTTPSHCLLGKLPRCHAADSCNGSAGHRGLESASIEKRERDHLRGDQASSW